MLEAMRVYRDVGYDGAIMPDHLPRHADDPDQRQAFAYAYGYVRALIQAVDAEARDA
jgi:mannonate dehydratase